VLVAALLVIAPVASVCAASPVIVLRVLSDGSVSLGGKHFDSDAAVEAKLEDLAKRNTLIHMDVDQKAPYAAVTHVLALCQKIRPNLKIGIVNTNQFVQ
jgi:biopolymer transport protein ExbD